MSREKTAPVSGQIASSVGSPWGAWLLTGVLVCWQLYVTGFDATADVGTFIQFGARKPSFGFPQPPWRLVASMFLHAGWIHLLCNLVLIGLWGSKLCRLVGPLAFFGVFFITGVWGSLLSDIFGPEALAIGASGGASGLVLSVLLLSLLAPQNPAWDGDAKAWFQSSAAVIVLNLTLAFGLTAGSQARLDHWAHTGGAVAGALLGVASFRDLSDGGKRGLWFGLLALGLAAATTIWFRGSSPLG